MNTILSINVDHSFRCTSDKCVSSAIRVFCSTTIFVNYEMRMTLRVTFDSSYCTINIDYYAELVENTGLRYFSKGEMVGLNALNEVPTVSSILS